MQPADVVAIVLALTALIGGVNHLWIRLPPAIAMLGGSLVFSLAIMVSDQVLHRGVTVLTWAGLRGGISVVLALTLPPSP